MKSNNKKNLGSLTGADKIKILHLAATGYPIKDLAKDYGIKYASIRTIILWEWRTEYPKHFAKHGANMSLRDLRSNPLKK
jgi:hypothetical protein